MNSQEINSKLDELQARLAVLGNSSPGPAEGDSELAAIRQEMENLKASLNQGPDSWERIRLARHEHRPYTLDYVKRLFEDFSEIHGDRRFGDDPAIVAGMADFEGQPVMIVGQQKGRDLKERQFRRFGCANPEGYRKALRAMRLAEKFNRPIFTFVDTQGAHPSIGAEERGQAEAIAYNLREMSALKVPIIVTVIGEGGSGGALGIGVGDRVLMLENSVYSVISPEGCSAILWKDQDHVQQAAQALKITAHDLLGFQLIDEIVPEPSDGAHTDFDATANLLRPYLRRYLSELMAVPTNELLDRRYAKFRKMGVIEVL
jgi:acetyl-CoA carboxylase carboxyl transferase subunit alpha